MPKSHVIGDARNLVKAVKASGFTDLEVGPLVGSSSKKRVVIADLEPVLDAAKGMVLTFRTAGNNFEVVDPDDVILATLATTA